MLTILMLGVYLGGVGLPDAHGAGPDWETPIAYREATDSDILAIDMAMDADGNFRVVYQPAYSGGDITYVEFDGTNHVATQLYNGNYQGSLQGYATDPRIAIRSDGHPECVFKVLDADGYELVKHVYRDAQGWHARTIDPNAYSLGGQRLSLVLDTNDLPHVAYDKQGHVWYARFDGTLWETMLVADEGAYPNMAITIDAAGVPHIAAANEQAHSLDCFSWSGSNWVAVQSFATGDVNGLDATADPVSERVWFSGFSGGGLILLHGLSNVWHWSHANVLTGTVVGATSIRVNNQHQPRVACILHDNSAFESRAVWYAQSDNGMDWAAYDTGFHAYNWCVSLALTPEGDPRLATAENFWLRLSAYTPPSAFFAATPEAGPTPLTVAFTNLSTGTIRGQIWDFGDGGSSTDLHPEHIYAQNGSYTVSLTVTNASDSVTETKHEMIDVQKWRMETVDAAQAGWYCSLIFDAQNRPHVAYGGQTNFYPILKYAVCVDGTDWHSEIVDARPHAGYASIAIAMNAHDQPCIAYTWLNTNGASDAYLELWFAEHDGSDWSLEMIDANLGSLDSSVSLAINPVGNPAVAYYDGNTNTMQLKYAVRSSGTWNATAIPGWSGRTHRISLRFNAGGYPRLSFYDWDDAGTGNLGYAHHDGTSWVIEVVDAPDGDETAAVGYSSSLALTGDGASRISYTVSIGNNHYHLRYAGHDGTAWRWTNTVADQGARYMTAGYTALAIDAADTPHISYFDYGNFALKYATLDGDQWLLETVDHGPQVGQYSSLALDHSNHVGIAYYDQANGKLKFAFTRQPPPLVADFSAVPRTGTAPTTVYFTDQSGGAIVSRAWSFGDGATSTETDPSHTYASNGIYTVSLTVTDPFKSHTRTRTGYIILGPLRADFEAVTGRWGPAPLSVSFTNRSTGSIASQLWSFGDGSESTDAHPTHVYEQTGVYAVTLTVYDPPASDTATRTDYVVVTDALDVDFTADPLSGPAPLSVCFSNQTRGNSGGWSWDFGDGQTAAEQHPVHVYDATGLYTVTLTASNASGAYTLAKTNLIWVSDFTVLRTTPRDGDQSACGNQIIEIIFTEDAIHVDETTFRVSDPAEQVNYTGTIEAVDAGRYRFTPGAPFPPGSNILVTLQGGVGGIVSDTSGQPLQNDYRFSFAIFPTIGLKIIQVLEGYESNLVAGKATMARVSVGPFAMTNATVEVTLFLDSDAAPLDTAVSPVCDVYNQLEQKMGRDTINFFLPTGTALDTPGDHELTAVVQWQGATQAVTACQRASVSVVTRLPVRSLGVEWVLIPEGDWDPFGGYMDFDAYRATAVSHADFMQAVLPLDNQRFTPFIRDTVILVSTWNPLVLISWDALWGVYSSHLDRLAKTDRAVDKVVGIVPRDLLGPRSGISRGQDIEGVLIEAAPEDYGVSLHEIMHSWGHYLDPLEEYQVYPDYGRLADGGWWVARGVNGCRTNIVATRYTRFDEIRTPQGRRFRVIQNDLQLHDRQFFSFMSNADPYAFWIRDEDYETLHEYFVGPINGVQAFDFELTPNPRQPLAGQLILVSGQIWSNGVVTVDPILSGDMLDDPTFPDWPWTHRADFYLSGGMVYQQPFNETTYPQSGELLASFCFTAQPFSEFDEIRILDDTETVLATLTSSAQAPYCQVLYPNGGETLTGQVDIVWQMADGDGDEMRASLYFSANMGGTWKPLALDVEGTNYTWDTRLSPATEHGLIKVVVSDGFLTAEDTSDNRFTLPGNAPLVMPRPPELVALSTDGALPIRFSCLAYDPKDGLLTGDAVTWQSDRDGVIGQGMDLALTDLAYGEHRIHAEAVNSIGLTGFGETVTVSIRPVIVDLDWSPVSNALHFSWFGRTGQAYQVLVSSNLNGTGWTVCSNLWRNAAGPIDAITGDGTYGGVGVTGPATEPSGCYRIRPINP